MATKTINQKITISGGDEIARTLRDLARLGEQAFAQLADAAKKIDLNLPVDKVKAQLVELGRSGQQAFGQLAQAAEKSVSSVKEVGTTSQASAKSVAEISPAAQKVAQDVASIGPAAQQGLGGIQQQASAASSALASIGTAIKVTGATLGGLAATFTALAAAATAMGKSASDAVISIGRAADAAGVSVSNFSRASTLLQQFGLTADQSAAAIKRLGEAGQAAFSSAVQSMQRLGQAGGETTTALQRALQGTQQTLEQIARTGGTAAASAARGMKVIVNEVALQNEETRAKFATQMASMADIVINGKRLFDEGTAAILKYAGAFNEVTGAARAPTEMLTELADRLQKIPDAAERARVLTAIFGKELGTALLPALERGTAAFVNMIGTIDRLRLKTTEAERKVGQDFRAAWDLLQAVIAKNNQEIGLLIAKPLTPFIVKFAEAMRRSADTFKIYEAAVNAVMPVIGKFLDEIAKIGAVDATFPETLKQGVQAFGDAVGAIFTNVIIPAFNGLKQIATDVAGTLTRLFSTNVTPAMVALGAALVALLGPINAIGVALVAIFSGEGPGFDAFREKLKAFGIDIDAIKAKFIELAQDIEFLFSGQEHLVKNEWLLDLKDALIQFKNEIGPAVTAGAAMLAFLVRWVGPANLARAAVVQLTGVLGFLVSAAQLLAATFISLFFGAKILGSVLGFIATASAPVAIALAAIAAAALLVATNLDTLLAAFEGIKALATGNLDRAQKAFELMGVGSKQASAGVEQLRSDLEKNPNMSGWERAISFMIGFIKREWQLFASDIEQFLNQLEQIAAAIAGVIDTIATAITSGLKSAFDTVVEAFRSTINIIVEAGRNLGSAIAQPFVNAFDTIKGQWDAMGDFIRTKVDQIKEWIASLNPFRGMLDQLSRAAGLADVGSGVPQKFTDTGLPEGQVEDRRGEAGDFTATVGNAANAAAEIVTIFQGLATQIAGILASITDPFQPLVQQAQAAVTLIIQTFQLLGQQIAAALATVAIDPFQPLVLAAQTAVNGIDAILQGVGQLVTSTFESINSAIASAASAVNSAIQQIISALQAAVAEAQALAAAAQQAAAAAAQAAASAADGGFARGGYTGDVGVRRVAGVVHGGEYVEPAHVVRQPGVRAFLETLRRVGNLREALRRFSKGFSVGGFVDDLAGRMSGALVPGFATGGLVPQVAAASSKPRNLGVLRLEAGGERFEVMADESTAFKLQRFARRQLMTSGGRAPVWER